MMLNGGTLNGTMILSAKTVDWIGSNHLPDHATMRDMPPPIEGGYSEISGPGMGFGLGFSVCVDPVATGQVRY
jgi:hypothetical protein